MNASLNIKNATALFFVIGISMVAGCSVNEQAQHPNASLENKKMRDTIPGEFVVGFKKEVSQEDAVAVLKKYNLDFVDGKHAAVSQKFFYKTGEKFIVRVADDHVKGWREKLMQEPLVEDTSAHFDSDVVNVD